jgi:glycosyltransferase XagB
MGIEFRVSDMERIAPLRSESVDDFAVNTNGEEHLSSFETLATVPLDWLDAAMPRLTADEQDTMLRRKVIPYVWLPNCVIYGAASADGLLWAQNAGLSVVGRIHANDYRSLVRRHYGQRLMRHAVTALEFSKPWASAKRRLTSAQIITAFGICSLIIACCSAYGFLPTWFAASGIASVFFTLIVGLRCLCLMRLPVVPGIVAPLLADCDLPVYTVMVPLFRETAVLPQLLHALSCLDYPLEKLDIKIILEENDKAMHLAVSRFDLPDYFDVIVVPTGKPQTKPRALNYAMQFARGTLLTIYDSEDIPQPNQLRLAAAQLAAADENVACLQAALQFYNPYQNWLTRQFAAEYAALFHVALPALAAYKVPLPLGGTSNHFKTSALDAVGGWDAFNVTEDADLGIRLARYGYQTSILHSSTFEEANPEIWNWMKQRRRWLKGFLQTWLVHNRNPFLLLKEVGPKGFCVVQCMTLGVFLSSLLHPILLLVTAWNLWPTRLAATLEQPWGAEITAFSLSILLLGYGSGLMLSARGLQRIGIEDWGRIVASIPLYWLLMSAAAWLALWDFCVAPYHWHKTKHGLSHKVSPAGQNFISHP